MSGVKEIFQQMRVKRSNQKLRDRLIAEGKINDPARKPTPRQDAKIDRALRSSGILQQSTR